MKNKNFAILVFLLGLVGQGFAMEGAIEPAAEQPKVKKYEDLTPAERAFKKLDDYMRFFGQISFSALSPEEQQELFPIINSFNDEGETLLTSALKHLQIVSYENRDQFNTYFSYLLVLGADVNVPNARGQTPLQLALDHLYVPAIAMLLGAGAQVREQDWRTLLDGPAIRYMFLMAVAQLASGETVGSMRQALLKEIESNQQLLEKPMSLDMSPEAAIAFVMMLFAKDSVPEKYHELIARILAFFYDNHMTHRIDFDYTKIREAYILPALRENNKNAFLNIIRDWLIDRYLYQRQHKWRLEGTDLVGPVLEALTSYINNGYYQTIVREVQKFIDEHERPATQVPESESEAEEEVRQEQQVSESVSESGKEEVLESERESESEETYWEEIFEQEGETPGGSVIGASRQPAEIKIPAGPGQGPGKPAAPKLEWKKPFAWAKAHYKNLLAAVTAGGAGAYALLQYLWGQEKLVDLTAPQLFDKVFAALQAADMKNIAKAYSIVVLNPAAVAQLGEAERQMLLAQVFAASDEFEKRREAGTQTKDEAEHSAWYIAKLARLLKPI